MVAVVIAPVFVVEPAVCARVVRVPVLRS